MHLTEKLASTDAVWLFAKGVTEQKYPKHANDFQSIENRFSNIGCCVKNLTGQRHANILAQVADVEGGTIWLE